MPKNRWIGITLVTLALVAAVSTPPALATERYGPLQVSGSLETQELIRHPSVDEWSLVQQRNTLRLRFDLDVVKDGKYFGTTGPGLPGVRNTVFFVLLRPDYDSIYDMRPGGRLDERPWCPDCKDGSLHAFAAKKSAVDSNRISDAGVNHVPHEAYADIELADIPLTLRIGKQQVVWGESDNFRLMDRVNPLDVTWHLQQENWVDLRKPLTMIKALYKTGDIGPIHESFLEVYWGLGDWTPIEAKFLPYPWSIATPPSIVPGTCTDPNNILTCQVFKFARGTLFRSGDYDHNPIDNGNMGARFVFNPMEGLNMSLAYFYNRYAFDDGSNPTQTPAFNITGPTPDIPLNNLISIGKGVLPAEVVYPHISTFGATATYDDTTYTQTVYRTEMIYELGDPFNKLSKPLIITNPACLTDPTSPQCTAASTVPFPGLWFAGKSDMWKGLLGFDRDTPIAWLNKRKTISFTGQFFWHYMVGNPLDFVGNTPTNKVRRWEVLSTLAAYTDYFTRCGIDTPSVFIAVDWANHYESEAGWSNNLFITSNFIFNLGQRYYYVPGFGGDVEENWGVAGAARKRDETQVKFTYLF